jgi:probable addiction module antidote protein
MAKTKTSAKRGKSLRTTKSKPFKIEEMPLVKIKNGVKFEEHKPDVFLKDTKLIREALIQAFFEGDVDGFKEILAAHLRAISKDDISKQTGVSRATVFRMLDSGSNPSFENVAKVVSALKIAV